MSWVKEGNLSLIHQLTLNILKCGEVPKHIALIMDGNRRYAKKLQVQKIEGHSKGFDKLSETLKWCLNLGVKEVTVYAFSIENFKRTKEEVDSLLDLARQKFEKLLEEEDKLNREGVNIRIIGNLSLLPTDLQKLIAKVNCMTRQNSVVRLNVAFAYTARDEITEATRCIVNAVASSEIEENDVNPTLLQGAMYTENSLPVDLLIRTSGEVRLSDFMLWQAAESIIYFTPVLWPDFSFWEFIRAIFQYQRTKPLLPPTHQDNISPAGLQFLTKLHNDRLLAQSTLLKTSC